jgi:hypothetical protein
MAPLWSAIAKRRRGADPTCLAAETPALPLVRPPLSQLAQMAPDQLPPFVQACPVALKYLRLLGELDWEHFPERATNRAWPGPQPQPRAPFVAAFLVKVAEQKRTMPRLRDFLVEHPALVWVLGFRLVASDAFTWGFDVQASLPDRRQFSRILRELPNECLQFLLTGTVHLLQAELPAEVALGDAISLDTKHILAWVKENNPKTYVADRFDKTQQPAGDPDCKLGCKERHNRAPEPPPTPTTDPQPATGKDVGEFYWGYASGVVATKNEWGEFVLAELTQPFNCSDVSYFFPLMAQVEARLGRRPRIGTLDAAYDAHYVYEYFHNAGGFAAVPLVARGKVDCRFDAQGLPLCAAGLAMPLKGTFWCKTTLFAHERGRYACPLLYPEASGQPCPQENHHFAQGGCLTTMATSIGARLRYQLDRESDAYKQAYNQRTAVERVNSLAKEEGIERPKLRNQRSIANQNTLIYVLLNLRALQRLRERQADQAPGA